MYYDLNNIYVVLNLIHLLTQSILTQSVYFFERLCTAISKIVV